MLLPQLVVKMIGKRIAIEMIQVTWLKSHIIIIQNHYNWDDPSKLQCYFCCQNRSCASLERSHKKNTLGAIPPQGRPTWDQPARPPSASEETPLPVGLCGCDMESFYTKDIKEPKKNLWQKLCHALVIQKRRSDWKKMKKSSISYIYNIIYI